MLRAAAPLKVPSGQLPRTETKSCFGFCPSLPLILADYAFPETKLFKVPYSVGSNNALKLAIMAISLFV